MYISSPLSCHLVLFTPPTKIKGNKLICIIFMSCIDHKFNLSIFHVSFPQENQMGKLEECWKLLSLPLLFSLPQSFFFSVQIYLQNNDPLAKVVQLGIKAKHMQRLAAFIRICETSQIPFMCICGFTTHERSGTWIIMPNCVNVICSLNCCKSCWL